MRVVLTHPPPCDDNYIYIYYNILFSQKIVLGHPLIRLNLSLFMAQITMTLAQPKPEIVTKT